MPISIPENWLTKKEASILGYTFQPNTRKTLNYITINESMFNYSTSNIAFNPLVNLLGLRIEGFLLRIRFVIYTILIVVLTPFPLACLLTILLLEIAHLITTFYYVIRYKYAKNWFLLASKVNVGVSVVVITALGVFIVIDNEEPSSF